MCATDKEKGLCGKMLEICVRGRHMALHNLESLGVMTVCVCVQEKNRHNQESMSSVTSSSC